MSFLTSRVTRKAGSPSALRQRIGESVARRLSGNPAIKRVNVPNAEIFYFPNYLSDRDCDTLIGKIDANRRKSTLLSDSSDPDFRTSDSCDLDRWSPEIRAIDERIAALMGIAVESGETLQGQRYAPGQQFRAHHDFFHETESYWPRMKAEGGQRTWTAMIFLNDVEEGGATWFPKAGVRFKPKRGFLLAWNNMLGDGSPNEDTLHEGTAVVQGTKYIVTKWFREGAWLR